VERPQRHRPDLIICDVQLPEIDGCEVARRLKADAELRTIPVVAVTALAMVGDRDRMLAAGFDGYLTKPISPEAFVRQMEGYLGCVPCRFPVAAGTGNGGAASAPARYAVLVVDNLPVNLELARSLLEPCGLQGGHRGRVRGQGWRWLSGYPLTSSFRTCACREDRAMIFLRAVRADPVSVRFPSWL